MCVLSHFSCVRLCATLRTATRQAPWCLIISVRHSDISQQTLLLSLVLSLWTWPKGLATSSQAKDRGMLY